MTRKTKKRVLFLGIVGIIGLGALVAYFGVLLPGRERRAMEDYRIAKAAYEVEDYETVLQHVGRYLGRHRDDASQTRLSRIRGSGAARITRRRQSNRLATERPGHAERSARRGHYAAGASVTQEV